MSRIFPFYNNPDIIVENADDKGGKRAEAALYRMLRDQLPDDWHVFYNWEFRNGAKSSQFDFLVVVPDWGILNLECKDSHEHKGGTYFKRKGDSDDNVYSPVSQAVGAIANFYRMIKDDYFNEDWALYAYAIVFPRQNFEGVDFRDNPIYTEKDCVDLKGICLRELANARRNLIENKRIPNPRVMNKTNEDVLIREMMRTGHPVDVLYETDINSTNFVMDSLLDVTRNQSSLEELWDFENQANQYIHVVGGAGTGKTWLAINAAQDFIRRGYRVLYVCYNQLLAADVYLRFPCNVRENENLVVGYFHRLDTLLFGKSLSLIGKDGKFDERLTDQNFLNVATTNKIKKFDVILVDEAQDFNDTKIKFILRIARIDRRKIIFFSDSEQMIYQNNNAVDAFPAFKGKLNVKKLLVNIRNSATIHTYSSLIIGDNGTRSVAKLKGPEVTEFENATINDINDYLNALFQEVSAKNVAILSNRRTDGLQLNVGNKRFYGRKEKFKDSLRNLQQWREGRNDVVWTSTIHAFKGLEAEYVILILRSDSANDISDLRLKYVGSTRAKYKLTVFYLK